MLYDEEVDEGPLPSPKLLKDMLQEMEASQVSPSKYMTGIQELYTDQYVSHVEEATRGQSDNPRWFRQREGRITASLFGAAARYSKDKANNYIVRKVLGCSAKFTSKHTEHGVQFEPVARQLYIEQELVDHRQGKCEESGLILCKFNPRYAASPDGLVSCKCCGEGLLEIKCSSKYKNKTREDIANVRGYHFTPDDNGKPTLKRTSSWYDQVQAQMFICERDWCDFMLYTLNGPPSVQRVYKDDEWLETAVPRVNRFYDRYILPKLLSQM